ncbi:GyrI-like domain-containing protein [Halobacillus litoralis]|uniref:GyrI-like domain-containing protein n=1 Tax=Halobacillus litoralis TaxID=45668 RepID=UPI001CFD89C2|nr:GyrI-like domain-containing protein [Halobacillus litoralis]
MEPEIIKIDRKKLVGKSKQMSLEVDTTTELWQSFMPLQKNISNRVDHRLYNMKIFDRGYGPDNFNTRTTFQKWAAVEVSDYTKATSELERYDLQGGWYAVFLHRGPARTFHKTLQYIFELWLPSSCYELEEREHFERLTEEYRPDDPDAVEEIWIPIRKSVGK